MGSFSVVNGAQFSVRFQTGILNGQLDRKCWMAARE